MRSHGDIPNYYFGPGKSNLVSRNPSMVLGMNRLFSLKKWPTLGEPEEREDSYILRLPMAGVNPKDLSIVIRGDYLILEIEKDFDGRKVAKDAWDKSYGVFQRQFQLPDDASKGRITYEIVNDELLLKIFKDSVQFADKPLPTSRLPEAEL